MKCPVCNVELTMADRQGVEIDYCPQCRGVWLDRGELDKIIERTNAAYTQAPPAPQSYERPHHESYKHQEYDPRYKKKKGFLGDLFDFD